jgi:hypothetical protein
MGQETPHPRVATWPNLLLTMPEFRRHLALILTRKSSIKRTAEGTNRKLGTSDRRGVRHCDNRARIDPARPPRAIDFSAKAHGEHDSGVASDTFLHTS